MSTPEADVKSEIKKVLAKHGVWFCMPIGTAYGKNGVPDFIGCMPRWKGRLIAIEAKRADKTGHVTALQANELRKIANAGGFSVIVDTDETLAALDTILSDGWDANCEQQWRRMIQWVDVHAARIS